MRRCWTPLGKGAVLLPPPLARAQRYSPLGEGAALQLAVRSPPWPARAPPRIEPARCRVEPVCAPPTDALDRTHAVARAPPHALCSRAARARRSPPAGPPRPTPCAARATVHQSAHAVLRPRPKGRAGAAVAQGPRVTVLGLTVGACPVRAAPGPF